MEYNLNMDTQWTLRNEPPERSAKVIAFINDLLFSSRLDGVARRSGFHLEVIGRPEDLALLKPNEGRSFTGVSLEELMSSISDLLIHLSPALILFDLNNTAIPWQELIPSLKANPATRRIPILCFGAHVDTRTLQLARSAGADAVVTRSQFSRKVGELLLRYARRPDSLGLVHACEEGLALSALKGLEEFNRANYFEAHELLEMAWREDAGPGRDLYRAIIQVAVAYLQIVRGNYRGARKMFLRLHQWIDHLPDICRGVDVAQLRDDALQVERALITLGEANIGEFDRSLLRPVKFVYPSGDFGR